MAALRTGEGLADVVVTAVSSTTALAPAAETTWQQLLEGQSGIRPLHKWFVEDCDSPVRIGGTLRENFDENLNRVELRRLSYLGKMALVLGRRLWDAAGSPEVDTNRLTVSVGLGLGTTEEMIMQYGDWQERGLRAMSPLAIQMYMPNAAAAAIGLEFKAKAGVIAPVMSDASGSAAVVQAWREIVLGEADVAICGGVETWIEGIPAGAFHGLGLMSTNNDDPPGACRPFDRHRDGMVLGEGETCTGDPARRAGNEFLFQMQAMQNVEVLNEIKATKIVVTCPHCLNALKREYPQLGGNYEVVHHTQLLNDLVKAGRLTPVAPVAEKVTYHDPCYLGRHNNVYVPPRELVDATGATRVEMERHGDKSFCCGAGGARMWMEEKIGTRVNQNRGDEAIGTGATKVAVACPFCSVMLNDAVVSRQSEGQATGVEVVDVATLLLSAAKS